MSVVWETRAPFYIGARWVWLTWRNDGHGGNHHAAIRAKADEVGAARWAYDQADHDIVEACAFPQVANRRTTP